MENMHLNSLLYHELEKKYLHDVLNFWDYHNSDLIIQPFEMIQSCKIAIKAVASHMATEWEAVKENSDLYEDYAFELMQSSDLINGSLLISAFGIIERNLGKLCKKYDSNSKIKVKDLAGSGIVKSVDYLEKVMGFNVKDQKHWPALDDARLVRNLFAHCSGDITESSEKVKLLKLPHTNKNYIIDEDMMRLNEDAIEEILVAGIMILKSVIIECKNKGTA